MSFEQLKEYFKECSSYREEDKMISLMRVGKFYEAYYSPKGEGSGKIVSEILHMHISSKKPSEEWSEKNPKFAGFPEYSLQKHLTKMNDLGYSVKIYEQEDDDTKKNKKRYLRGIYTKNIRMDFDTIDSMPENSCVFSYILEKYPIQKGNIRYYEYKQNICWYDSNVGKVYFSEMVDINFYRMLEQFIIQYTPVELLFYIDGIEEERDEIRKVLDENGLKQVKIKSCNEIISFSEMEKKMETCFLEKPSLEYYPIMSRNVYYLLDYIEKHNSNYAKDILVSKDCWVQMEDTPFIHFNRDVFRELFLFTSNEERTDGVSSIKSIYDMLSIGMNTMGKRLLYKILQHPLTSISKIKERYKKIEEINVSKKIFSNIIDLEYYILRWRRRAIKEYNIASIFITYKKLEEYYNEIKPLNEYITEIWDLEKMSQGEMFFKNISEEYMGWKKDYDIYYNNLNKLEEESYNITFYFDKDIVGSYYQITNHRWSKLGVKKQEKFRVIGTTSTYKKIMYKEYDNYLFKMKTIKDFMNQYEKDKLEEDTKYILERFGKVMETTNEKISSDSLYSVLKSFYKKNGYCSPIIREEDDFYLEIKNIRHSLIEYLNPNEMFIPFSYEMNSKNIGSVIYGMNSSGKSTFMKSITLGLWFAQCGLWVSASSFIYTPVYQIFTKFSHFDNLFKQQSLFVSEISELKYILDRIIPKRSFLCLDELTSGTEIFSSGSLIISLLEYFIQKEIPFLFTTHIHFISEYIQKHLKDRIQLYHFDMNEKKYKNLLITSDKSDFYNRSLEKGSGRSQYGIEVAEQLGLPKSIIEKSYSLRRYIRCDYIEEKPRRSRYNKELEVRECFKCFSRENLHTHHIFPQENFKGDEVTIQKDGFRKNALYNLLVLCHECHEELHFSSNKKEEIIETIS